MLHECIQQTLSHAWKRTPSIFYSPRLKRACAGQLVKIKRNERRGLDSPKTSLLQNQFNVSWNMAPKGVTRGGMRTPNAHDERVHEGQKPPSSATRKSSHL